MKKASISEAKNQLSALIDRVREGETVYITDRGRPVARLQPIVSQTRMDEEGILARLERAGIVRKGTARPPLAAIEAPAPKLRPGASIVRALRRERSEDR